MRLHLPDRIAEICCGKFVLAAKCITLADKVFNDHFRDSLSQVGPTQPGRSFFEIVMGVDGGLIRGI